MVDPWGHKYEAIDYLLDFISPLRRPYLLPLPLSIRAFASRRLIFFLCCCLFYIHARDALFFFLVFSDRCCRWRSGDRTYLPNRKPVRILEFQYLILFFAPFSALPLFLRCRTQKVGPDRTEGGRRRRRRRRNGSLGFKLFVYVEGICVFFFIFGSGKGVGLFRGGEMALIRGAL